MFMFPDDLYSVNALKSRSSNWNYVRIAVRVYPPDSPRFFKIEEIIKITMVMWLPSGVWPWHIFIHFHLHKSGSGPIVAIFLCHHALIFWVITQINSGPKKSVFPNKKISCFPREMTNLHEVIIPGDPVPKPVPKPGTLGIQAVLRLRDTIRSPASPAGSRRSSCSAWEEWWFHQEKDDL